MKPPRVIEFANGAIRIAELAAVDRVDVAGSCTVKAHMRSGAVFSMHYGNLEDGLGVQRLLVDAMKADANRA